MTIDKDELKEKEGSKEKEGISEAKKELISEFLNHPVTLELLSGASGSNISNTLNGTSNLFSFIGSSEFTYLSWNQTRWNLSKYLIILSFTLIGLTSIKEG